MAYVYRHIRLDKNEVFYIGIGLKDDPEYKRAHTSLGRNKFWQSVATKSGFEVHIMMDGLSEKEVYVKEKEFIAIYKRRRDGGTLCNLTLGGEGQAGMIPWSYGKKFSAEYRAKLSKAKKGKPCAANKYPKTAEHMEKLHQSRRGKSSWNKGHKYSEEKCKQMSEVRIGKMVGEKHPNYGKKFSEESRNKMKVKLRERFESGWVVWNKGRSMGSEELKAHRERRKHQMKVIIQCRLDGEPLIEWESLGEAARAMGIRKGHISNVIHGRVKSYKGFKWKLKEKEMP